MKRIQIEFKRREFDGPVCIRCSTTEKTLRQAVAELAQRCQPHGIDIELKEVRLQNGQIAESNVILFNGVPLENLVPEASVARTYCESCSSATGTETHCRAIEHGGKLYDAIPEALIWAAAAHVLAKECQ